MNLANWRSTVFGSITMLAAFVTQYPELLAALLDPAAVKKVSAFAGLVSGLIAFANAKDKQVTGNGTVYHPNQVADGKGGNTTLPLPLLAAGLGLAFVAALAAGSLALLTGCSTTTGNPATDRRHAVENQLAREAARVLGRIAFATLTNVAGAELSGGRADWGHAASQAVWSSAGSIVDSAALERVINAGTARQLPAVASEAGHQFAVAVDKGVPPQTAANAVAAAISAAALKAP